MAEILSLQDERTKREPHLSGKARCMACKHEWVAVAPIGVTRLECPKCQCDGHMTGTVMTDYLQLECGCGYDLFRVDEHGVYCPNCGTRHETPGDE